MSDQFIGVDVGGTKIAVAVLEGGELSESRIVSTEQASQEALVEQLAAAIEGSVTSETRAVGIGMPSVIEFATGKILASVNIPLHDIPLRAAADRAHGRAGLRRERRGLRGAGRGLRGRPDDGRLASSCSRSAPASAAAGCSTARLYRGATTSAAEVGHTIIGRDLDVGRQRARATRSRSAARWRRWPPGARWTGSPTRPRSSTATPTSARCCAKKGDVDGHDVVAGAEAGDEPSL